MVSLIDVEVKLHGLLSGIWSCEVNVGTFVRVSLRKWRWISIEQRNQSHTNVCRDHEIFYTSFFSFFQILNITHLCFYAKVTTTQKKKGTLILINTLSVMLQQLCWFIVWSKCKRVHFYNIASRFPEVFISPTDCSISQFSLFWWKLISLALKDYTCSHCKWGIKDKSLRGNHLHQRVLCPLEQLTN